MDSSPRLLIPITRARAAPGLLEVAAAVLRAERGSGHVLGVVEQPLGRPIAENVTVARRYRELLRRITGLERRAQAGLGVQVRVASTLAQGVRESAYENAAELIVLGWPGPDAYPAQPMVGQMRAVLDGYQRAGGRYTERVLARCGHSPHLERPGEFAEVVTQFLGGAG